MTENHSGFNTIAKGEQDWHIPLNDTIEELDREVPVRDKESNLSDYSPKAEALFVATDTGAVYSADGATWYREDWVVDDFEAKGSITFPDGSTVTSPGSGSAVDFEEDGTAVVQNASAANFIEAGAATVNVSDDGDGTVTIEVSATDTNTERTAEEIEDIVAALVSGGSNITTTYDDVNDTLTFDGLSDEQVEDLVGAMAGTNLSYDDSAGVLNATDTNLTDEEVQDIVGPFITGGSNVTVTYDDAGNTLTVDATDTNLSDEEVEDIIGAAVNTGLSYDDANNQINLTSTDVTVAGNTVSLGGSTPVDHADLSNIGAADHHNRYTDEESQDAVGTILGTNFNYSDATPSITLANDTVTVAGNSIALGGSSGVDHADLSNIGAADHHTRYSDEESQDAVGTILGSNFTYDDATPAISLTSDTVTVAGNTVSLGGSTIINHADLSNINADQHVDHSTVSINAGNALNGGGDITSSRTLDVVESAIDRSNLSGSLAGIPLKETGDSLVWALSPDDDLLLRNTTDSKEIWEIDQDTGDIEFYQVGGNPLLFSHNHTALGDTIPNTGLTNDSITINAGTDLTGGGTPSLGGSVTIDFDASSVSPSQLGGGDPFDIGTRSLSADGKSIFNFSGGPSNQGELNARYNGPYARSDLFAVADTASNPSLNGQIKRNGGDILAYSGGAIRNLSNIGSSGGAPTDASYLTRESESGLSNETVVSAYPFGSSDIASGAITDAEIATGAVTSTEVLDGTLTSADWNTESFQDQVGGMAGSNLTYDDANGVLDATGGGTSFTQLSASSDYTASPFDSVWANGASNTVTITLPSPSQSDEVRVTATDTTNAVTLSENGSEGIQTPEGTVSTYTLVEDETVHVESSGTTWRIVSGLTAELDSGQLGTLATSVDTDDFRISNVAGSETQGVADVSVFPRADINEDYAFNAIDWYREWDESTGELDVVVTVNWDTKPSAGLDLDYVVWKGAGGAGGGSGGSSDESFTTTGPITSSTYTATWDEVVVADTSGGSITVTLPSPQDTKQVTMKKAASANTLTIARPGSQNIDGDASDIDITAEDASRTLVSDGTDYWVI